MRAAQKVARAARWAAQGRRSYSFRPLAELAESDVRTLTAADLVCRAKSVESIAKLVGSRSPGSRCLVLTSTNGETEDRAGPVMYHLRRGGLRPMPFAVQDGTCSVPSITSASIMARRLGCEMVVAVGGSGVLDLGKALALVLANPGDPREYLAELGARRLKKSSDERAEILPSLPSAPCFLVPTCPSSSELRRDAFVLIDSNVALPLRPRPESVQMAVVDPELARSLSPELTLSTGLACLSHAIETYIAPTASAASRRVSAAAIMRVAGALRAATLDGSKVEHRTWLAEASLLASAALNTTPAGVTRGVGIAVGGRYNIKYSQVVAATFRAFLSSTIEKLEEVVEEDDGGPEFATLERLAQVNTLVQRAMERGPNASAEEVHESSEEFPALPATHTDLDQTLDRLVDGLPMPSLEDFDFTEVDYQNMASASEVDPNTTGYVVPFSKSELASILKEC